MRMVKADGGAVYPVDLLSYAVIHRSINLVQGFAYLIEKRNFICAAPLLRLQLDNCLRFSAVFLVSDCHEFATQVLKGRPVRRMKDKSGALMNDSYLVKKLAVDHPWVERVYTRTSGYIHLSETHFYNTLIPQTQAAQEKGVQAFHIGPGDSFETDEVYEEATEAFVETTRVLMKYLIGWVQTKELAERRCR